MSRCFPYPPPGYKLSRASYEALIESIKLQKEKEKEKTKADRKKEKKREKDVKKKSKKEKAKQTSKYDDSCGGKSWGNSKDGVLQKERNDDTEQLERSSITEEHELAQNPSYSSDSTQNSNKRKRHTSALNSTHAIQGTSASNGTRVQGNILRIRLPSQKNIKCDLSGENQQLSTSVRREIPPDTVASLAEPDKTCCTSVATPSIAQALPPLGPENELRQADSQQTPEDTSGSGGHGSKRFKKMQRVVQKYSDLIENWIPPNHQLPSSDVDDDQDWLFGIKREQKQIHPDKTNVVDNQISCSTSASLWPTAQYLPGADIYALPYTVPF